MRVLDLFSGRGGFSQAFLDRGHDVTRFDNNERFRDVPSTEIRDVLTLRPGELKKPDVVLAGIDCTFLTHANSNPDPKDYQLSKELVLHTMKLIAILGPDWWAAENPKASRLWDIIGPPTHITEWGAWGTPYRKPTGIKGRLPLIEWPKRYREPPRKESWDRETFQRYKFAYLAPREASKRSLIPYPFSLALCTGMEEQIPPKPITDYFEATPAATSTALRVSHETHDSNEQTEVESNG